MFFCIFLLYFVMTVFSELLHTVLFRGENMIGVTRLATAGEYDEYESYY